MTEVLQKGTVESLVVAMRDRLENITDLAPLTNRFFDVKKKSDNTAIQTGVAWTVDPDFPMEAICEIDTTLVGYVGGEYYKLYIRWTSGSESPRKGPLLFRVEDD